MNTRPKIPDYSALVTRLENCLPDFERTVTSTEFKIRSKEFEIHKIVLGRGNPRRALITAGIHGDEPAGVETVLHFLESGRYKHYTGQWEITLVPCINPSGWSLGTRENADGVDLNRKFKELSVPSEVQWVQFLFSEPYHLDLELHEDVDSHGYYLYQKEKPPISPLGVKIIDGVSEIMEINRDSEIEGMPAEEGVLSRLSDPDEMEWWPMALYAAMKGCQKVFTLETATRFPMELRVSAHLKALDIALKHG